MTSRGHLNSEAWAEVVKLSAAINSSLELEHVLNAIARAAANITDAEASSVLLLDRRRSKLTFAAAAGPVGEDLIGREFDASLGIAGRVVERAEPEVVRDVSRDPAFFSGIDQRSSFATREVLAAPMIYRANVVGVVEVVNRQGGKFDDEDLVILKLFADLAATAIQNAQTHQQLKREYEGLRTGLGDAGIVGSSEALCQVDTLCQRVAPSNATVLLLGETGTGKELTARYIHQLSGRRSKPFIGTNCAALTETLLESELFGHERGAFTGAVGRKAGRFELADGGTLFLDEIGEISPALQVKLLRVLQEREFVRVGGTQSIACDVRVIAATNRDLQSAVSDGEFREDLFYRLNVFPIRLPPLRERREDIPLLVEQFVAQSAGRLNVGVPSVSTDALAILASHHWPGNIRELQNVVERMVLMCDGGEILPMHVPREIAATARETIDVQPESGLRGYERAMIIQALNGTKWNQTRAAEVLGISRDNLRYRLKKYNIQRPR